MAHLVAMFTYCYSVFNIVEICVLSVIEIRIRSVRRYLVKKRRSKKPSLITPHSIFVTHHLSLKIPQFSKPHTFGTLFLAFHHLNISTVCRTHILALGQIFANVHVINKKKLFTFLVSISKDLSLSTSLLPVVLVFILALWTNCLAVGLEC